MADPYLELKGQEGGGGGATSFPGYFILPPLERMRKEGLSSFAPGGKMKDLGNEVGGGRRGGFNLFALPAFFPPIFFLF